MPAGLIGAQWLLGQTLALTDTFWAIDVLAFIAVVCILIPEGILKNRETPYPFETNGYYDRFL